MALLNRVHLNLPSNGAEAVGVLMSVVSNIVLDLLTMVALPAAVHRHIPCRVPLFGSEMAAVQRDERLLDDHAEPDETRMRRVPQKIIDPLDRHPLGLQLGSGRPQALEGLLELGDPRNHREFAMPEVEQMIAEMRKEKAALADREQKLRQLEDRLLICLRSSTVVGGVRLSRIASEPRSTPLPALGTLRR